MLDSVQLRLMIGPVVPADAAAAVMDALAEVEVKVSDVGQSGFSSPSASTSSRRCRFCSC